MIILENVGWLLVMIGVMILIHELGHFWAARYFDVRVEAFSFGFGPRLFGFKRGDTDFRFSLILFGGYVKMSGEQPGEGDAADPRGFLAKPRWQRLVIAFAGPFMNMVLAVALLAGLFMVHFPKSPALEGPAIVAHVTANGPAARAGVREGDRIVRLDDQVDPTWEDVFIREMSGADRPMRLVIDRNGEQIITSVTPVYDKSAGVGLAGWSPQNEILVGSLSEGMPASRAGLQPGDVLISANGQPIRSTLKLQEITAASNGKPVEIVYSRNGSRNKVVAVPEFRQPENRWMIGLVPQPRIIITKLSFPDAVVESVRHNIRSAGLIYSFLRGIIENRLSPKSLEGPIRIAQLSGEAAREGATTFIGLMATVSLNLAIFNLLPIPILDGGVILLLLVEMIIRRDLSMQVKETVFKLGFVFLMAIVVFVLYNDISKILPS